MPATPAATPAADFVQLPALQPAPLRDELAQGLLLPRPAIAPKFLYDALGARLFEAITALDEYYPTRTEASILERHGDALAQACGLGHTLVDLGAGNCAKAARLFGVLRPSRYVAVDISVEFLRHSLQALQVQHPQLPMLGVGMDFSTSLRLPAQAGGGTRLMFYPGSSIGNFTPEAAERFLRRVRAAAPQGALLIEQQITDVRAKIALYDGGLVKGLAEAIGVALFERKGLRRILVVSDFTHLPRIKLTYQLAGQQVFTVPARELPRLSQLLFQLGRETAAFWAYYFRMGR